jgi:hypothetical protein
MHAHLQSVHRNAQKCTGRSKGRSEESGMHRNAQMRALAVGDVSCKPTARCGLRQGQAQCTAPSHTVETWHRMFNGPNCNIYFCKLCYQCVDCTFLCHQSTLDTCLYLVSSDFLVALHTGQCSTTMMQVVRHVRATQGPDCRLFAVGFSAGSNCLAKYVGETGRQCPLTAAASVANAFDIRLGLAYVRKHARLLDRCVTSVSPQKS